MKKKGFLIIVSGPSGVGKGTICQRLFENKDLNLAYSVSMTTREKRIDEIEGESYFFVDRARFEMAIQNNELIEHAEFVGNYYGTPWSYCEEQIILGKNVILEIEVQGATQVLEKIIDAVSIFLIPPSMTELESRIRGRRSETEEVLQARLEKANDEVPLQDNYDYVVVNETVDQAVEEITIILKEEIKRRAMIE